MSENFLSFISNVEAKSADAGVPEAASVSENPLKVLNLIVFLRRSGAKLRGRRWQEAPLAKNMGQR